jgi:HEAT repeat protein
MASTRAHLLPDLDRRPSCCYAWLGRLTLSQLQYVLHMDNVMILQYSPWAWSSYVLVGSLLVSLLAWPLAGYAQVDTLTDEAALIAILSGDSPKADKAMACKRLAVYGTPAAVPELAKLLKDPQLASWTRIALEAIPGSASDEALRTSSAALEGNLLIGTINSLGVRRDAAAVELLAGYLQAAPDVAEAAAIALGKIGNQPAATVLRQHLTTTTGQVRSAVAQAGVLCAEQFAAAGNKPLAMEIYDQVRLATDLPKQRIVEATRGAILVRGKDGIPLLLEALRSPEKTLFHVALQSAREMPSPELASALLTEVKTAPSDRAPLIVQALADMPGTVDAETIIQLAAQPGSQEVRMAALGAIGRTGNASCVLPLLKLATESEELLSPVKAALVELQDEAVNQAVVERLGVSSNAIETQLLLEIIGLRRISATDSLLKALESPQANIRTAALESLGSTVTQDQLSLLITQVVQPKHAADASAAQQALKAAAIRMPDREACAAELSAALANVKGTPQIAMLEILGEMGGPTSLKTLGTYAQHNDMQLKDAASRLLGEWMTIDAAPVLLNLATSGPADRYQVRAMRGYIRIARQFVMPEETRVTMCTEAMQAAKQDAERKLVIEILERYPSVGTLKLALEARRKASLQADALRAVKSIAEKLKDNTEAQELVKQAGLTL